MRDSSPPSAVEFRAGKDFAPCPRPPLQGDAPSPGRRTMSESQLDLVRRSAELARLEITAEEALALTRDFEAILRHFEVLSTLDVDEVPPTLGGSDLVDVTRADLPRASLPVDDLLRNAPDPQPPYYGVPKTVGGSE